MTPILLIPFQDLDLVDIPLFADVFDGEEMILHLPLANTCHV